MSVTFKSLPYGFRWGPVEVKRLLTTNRNDANSGVVLSLITDRQEIDIYVTPTGIIRLSEPKKIKKSKSTKFAARLQRIINAYREVFVSTLPEGQQQRGRLIQEMLDLSMDEACPIDVRDNATDILREAYVFMSAKQRNLVVLLVQDYLSRQTDETVIEVCKDFLNLHENICKKNLHLRDHELARVKSS